MKTVRITLAMAVALSIAIPVMAQETKPDKGKAAKLSPTARVMLKMGKLREAIGGLDLSAEQEEKLDKIREEFRPKMGVAFGKLRDILTEDQRTAAEKAAKKAREAGKKGRDLMLAIESSLNLTDEQKEKTDIVGKEEWGPLCHEMTKKIMAILTPKQKGKVKKAMAPEGRKERKPRDKKDKASKPEKTE